MKIQKIACPSCGFSFEIKELKNSGVHQCPSCKASLYLEEDKAPVVNININHYGSDSSEPILSTTKKTTGVMGLAILAFFVIVTFGVINSFNSTAVLDKATYTYRTVPNSEPFIKFVEHVYDKALDNISTEDYQKISYLYVERACLADDWTNANKYPWRFDYAFSVDQNGNPIDVKSVLVDSKADVEKRDLQAFTNIVNANFGKYGEFVWDGVSYNNIDYQNLQKLQYYKGDDFGALLNAFEDPARIKSLDVKYLRLNDETGDDISAFSGLKQLTVEYIDNNEQLAELNKLKTLESLNLERLDANYKMDLAFLTSLIKLKSLKIETSSDVQLINLDVFYGMPSIEDLDLENIQQLKSIDFLNNMPKLTRLKIKDCPIIDIEPMRNSITLTELSLDHLSALSDVSALPTIKNLKKLELLALEFDEQKMPSLAGLAMLNTLTIDTDYLEAIYGMQQLQNLNIVGHYWADKGIINSLVGLKKLDITLRENDVEINSAIAKLPNLENLTIGFSYSRVYLIDSIFTSNSITSLTIANSDIFDEKLQLDFDNMADNAVLKKLLIADVNMVDAKLKDAAQDSKLGQYTDQFFKHFSALEELNVAKNQINNLDFVGNLPNLKMLDISDNYVTDVTPLSNCKKLELLKCQRNPIANLEILSDSIQVFADQ